jgi:parallel beta-helix repeat protein
MRLIMIALLVVMCSDVMYCQNYEYKEYNFENGTQSLDANWIQGYGNWIGSDESCLAGKHSLSTSEVNCPASANYTVMNVIGPSHLEFSWKKSGANTEMAVYLDDSETQSDYCRGFEWSSSNLNIPSGTHKIKWVLNFTRSKDGRCIAGTKGTGWLCNVKIPFSVENSVPTIVPVTTQPIEPIIPKHENINPIVPVTTQPIESIIPKHENITPTYYEDTCRNISANDDLVKIVGNSTGCRFCLDNGCHNGTINITGANDVIIQSKMLYEAQIKGESTRCNLILYKCNNVTISGLNLVEGLNGIWLKNSRNCKIFNNMITTINGFGVYLSNGSSDNQIIGNYIEDIDSTPHRLQPDRRQPEIVIEESDYNTISYNNIETEGYDYLLERGSNNKIHMDQNGSININDREYLINFNSSGNLCIFRIFDARKIKIGSEIVDENHNSLSCEV